MHESIECVPESMAAHAASPQKEGARMTCVLHVITGLATGGAETALYRLIRNASSACSHRVVSLTRGGAMLPLFADAGIPVTQLDFRRRPAAGFLALVRLIRASRPDIVQTWMYHADLIGGLAARLAGNRRVIWGIRTTAIDGGSRVTALVRRACAALSASLPSRIVCVADAARIAHAAHGYDARRMVVVHNGFDADIDAPVRRALLRERCGFAPDDIVVGSIARFDHDKDLPNMVRAAGLVAAREPRARFLLIGHCGKDEAAQLRAWMRDARCEDRFMLLEARTDAADYLAALDLYCLSSRNEGFPNAVGEAMACALPCVVTDVGDAAHLVGDAGVVVPKENPQALADGIEALLRLDAAARRALGQRALARVHERFSSRHARERFEALYRQVLKGG